MTKFYKKNLICCCCGKSSIHKGVLSTYFYCDEHDFDLRPVGPEKFLQTYELEECPCCGYVNPDIEQGCNEIIKQLVNSKRYKTIEGLHLRNKDARKFVKYALICNRNQEFREEAVAYIHAAWMCDDAHEKKGAIQTRSRAADLLIKQYENGQLSCEDMLVLTDALRRSQRFEEALSLLAQYKHRDNLESGIILLFQSFAIKKHDEKRYKWSKEGIQENPLK